MTSTFRSCLLASTMLVAGMATPAFAQQQTVPEAEKPAEPASEIVVTGTRISRPDLELASPVNVISQQEIQFRQPGTADDLLRSLPAIRPSIGAGVNNGSDGSSTLNLRGMGEQRTLVLLDGRRLVPYGLDGLTDTNNIPVALLQRVEVFTGGASSTYGADAVSGVVNFITRRDFSGIDASASYRVSERGDSQRFKADLVVGGNFADGRGNVVLAVGYTKADPLLHLDRKISEVPISSTTGSFAGSSTAAVTIFGAPSNASLGLAASSFGAVVNPTTGLLQSATAADTYNTNIGTYFQTPLDRINAYSAGHYEITPGIEFYGSAMFTRNQIATQLASSGTFNNTYQLALNNPYLPAGLRSQLCTATKISAADCATAAAVQGGPGTAGYREIPVVAQRRFTEYGPRGNVFESQMFQVQGGFRGEIVTGLKYDVSAQYGETTQNQTRQNWGSFSKVQQALRAYRDASGNIRCADTSNGCVPLNLFGPNGSITKAQLAFIDLSAIINRKVTQTVVTGSVSGDLFTSPLAASKIAFAVGGEYRKITAASQPDGPSQVQGEVLGTGARTPPDTGRYSVKEVFGELIAPLVEDKPFIHKLTAEAGIRYSDYSTTGGSTTWKAGGQWEPVPGFKFRGTYQVAVRSPNIQELFQSPVQGLGNLTVDPCAGTGVLSNAKLAALCVATGAPSGTIGSIAQPSSGQINNTTAGNRNLDVERAKTLTLGGVFTPTFLKGFSMKVDYFRIKVSNAITQPAQADILNGCYSAALNPNYVNNAFCALIGRNPLTGTLNGAGETPGVILSYSNLGLIRTAGIDLGIDQRVLLQDIGIKDSGAISIGFNGTYLDYYRFQANPNSIDRNCTGRYSAGGCTNPRAKIRWNGRLTYDRQAFDVSLLWTHISHVSLEDPIGSILPQFARIPAYDYFDLSFGVRPTKNLSFNLTVNNLLDKAPPLVGSGVGGTSYNSGNTFPTIYDPIGRSYTLGARLTF